MDSYKNTNPILYIDKKDPEKYQYWYEKYKSRWQIGGSIMAIKNSKFNISEEDFFEEKKEEVKKVKY